MPRRPGKACTSVGAHGDVPSFECGHAVLPKRGLKRSPGLRTQRQRKYARRRSSSSVRRSTVTRARDADEGAVFSPGRGPEGTDGSDCDEALEDCIPVQPGEVLDLVDEQTASDSEEQKETDSDETIDSEEPEPGIQEVMCALPYRRAAASTAASDKCCTVELNATPGITQQKQLIKSTNYVDEATVQSTVVNRPVPLPPIIKAAPVTRSISQEALLVYAPVDLTQWPIGQLATAAQDPSIHFKSAHEGLEDATSDCIPPPCDLPDCDDWLGIDNSPAAFAVQPPKAGNRCPSQGTGGCGVIKMPATLSTSSESPPGVTAARELGPQVFAGPQCALSLQVAFQALPDPTSDSPDTAPAPASSLPQSDLGTPQSLSMNMLEPLACASCTCSVQAQAALHRKLPTRQRSELTTTACADMNSGRPDIMIHRRRHEEVGIEEAAARDTCRAFVDTSPCTQRRGSNAMYPASGIAGCVVAEASEGNVAHGEPRPVEAQSVYELADSGSPTMLPCVYLHGGHRSPIDSRVHEHDEGMHWLLSPLQQSGSQEFDMSSAALISPGQTCSWPCSRPSRGRISSSRCPNPSEVKSQPATSARATADGSSAGPALRSACMFPASPCHVSQPTAACRAPVCGAGDGFGPSDHPAPPLELEDDDLYRIFAMTCTNSPGDEEPTVPASFMDLLLNEEDENDLDWLDAEAPRVNRLPESPVNMSPDGPHAHTRLRLLGQGQLSPRSPAQLSPGSLFNSCSSAGLGEITFATSSRAAEVAEPSGNPCSDDVTPAWSSHGIHSGCETDAAADAPQELMFSHSQLRQLYAQVQAHAQLLLQTFLLASQGQVSIAAKRDVEKLWAWSDSSLKSGPLREEQDGIASDTWGMMVDLINLDRKLSDGHPENRIPAPMLAAITPHGCQHDPKRMVKELEDGWRPVLLHPGVPSIVHVPWLTHLDALVQTCGICMTCLSEGHAVLTKVSCDSFSQVGTDAACPSKVGMFMQPLYDDPDVAPGCRRNMRAFRSSPFTTHIQNVLAQYAVWWNRGLFPRIDGSRSTYSRSRRKAATLVDERILATLVLHYGRDYAAMADAVPGWTEDLVRVKIRNNGRKDLINEPAARNSPAKDMRACIKDTVQKALESVDGELTPDEHLILMPLIRNEDCLAHDWDKIAAQHVPWRKPALLKRMWLKACKEGRVTGIARPTNAWWAARSRSLLTGANRCLWADDETAVEGDRYIASLLHDKNQEYELKLMNHAVALCAS